MSTPSPSGGVCPAAQSTRSSTQPEQKKARPTDPRSLQLLEDHRPWEAFDDTVLTIIDQTYAALLDILGLAAAPLEGGRAVKVVTHLATDATDDTDDDDPGSPEPSPVLRVVVEASPGHCRTSLIGSFDSGWWEVEDTRYVSVFQTGRRRQRVGTAPGRVFLSRVDDDGQGDNHQGRKNVEEFGPAGVPEEAMLGVLDAMRSRLDTAIQVETGMMTTARASGCRNKRKAIDRFLVRMALEGMRRQLDVGAIMRRCRCRRQYYRRARETGRRRPADEMDVDQVDETEVLTKRLKAMHV